VDGGQGGALFRVPQDVQQDIGLDDGEARRGQAAVHILLHLNADPPILAQNPTLFRRGHVLASFPIVRNETISYLIVYTTARLACEIQICYIQ
jgi:hypothetical protein